MHIEPRLLVFTKGIRLRIAAAVALGLLSVGLGVARLVSAHREKFVRMTFDLFGHRTVDEPRRGRQPALV